MKKRHDDQAMALGGVLQATSLVDQTARTGLSDVEPMAASLGSLVAFDPPTTVSVYGGIGHLETGLRLLKKLLETPATLASQPGGVYGMAVLKLERRLARNPGVLETLGHQLRAFAAGMEEPITGEDNVAALAHIYSENLSALPPRIIVNGEPQLLQRQDVAERIRALLLAAVRSAVLWRQKGGRPYKLLLNRRPLFEAADRLLGEAVTANVRRPADRQLP